MPRLAGQNSSGDAGFAAEAHQMRHRSPKATSPKAMSSKFNETRAHTTRDGLLHLELDIELR
jgi:hypothetical protein